MKCSLIKFMILLYMRPYDRPHQIEHWKQGGHKKACGKKAEGSELFKGTKLMAAKVTSNKPATDTSTSHKR